MINSPGGHFNCAGGFKTATYPVIEGFGGPARLEFRGSDSFGSGGGSGGPPQWGEPKQPQTLFVLIFAKLLPSFVGGGLVKWGINAFITSEDGKLNINNQTTLFCNEDDFSSLTDMGCRMGRDFGGDNVVVNVISQTSEMVMNNLDWLFYSALLLVAIQSLIAVRNNAREGRELSYA